MLRRIHPLTALLLLVGLVSALVVLTFRYRSEARSRAVALVVDDGQVRSLAVATGVPVVRAYQRFSGAITGVSVTEETLADLQAEGALQVHVTWDGAARVYSVAIPDRTLESRVLEYVPRFIRSATTTSPPSTEMVVFATPGGYLYVPGRFEEIRSTPIGVDPAVVKQIREAGLEPVGRIGNPLGLTRESLRWYLGRLKEQGVTTFIFTGDEVLGQKGLIEETAAAFRDLGLIYGSVEMGKQRGDDLLSRRLLDRMVRVHSISSAEMARLTPQEAVERYARAAVERNIRLVYVRLPGSVTAQTFEDSLDLTKKLATELVDEGFGRASPVPFRAVLPSPLLEKLLQGLIALGIGAGAALLAAGLVPLAAGRQAALALGLGLICAALAASGIGLGLQLVALLAAGVFPTLAFVLFPQPVAAFEEHEHATVRERGEAIVPAVAEFAAISLVTLAGALLVAGTLSQLPYMVKVKSFAGIKAATVIPLFLVGWMYLTGMSGAYPSWTEEREAVTRRLRRFFDEPVRVWHAAAFVVGMVALALLVARSGNEPGIGVSDLELRFRALLDRVLGVRPRTKEFLLGHPVLLLSLAMAALPRWRGLAFPLLLVGAIGQVGMLNSFCHLHSPLKLTLLRTFHGLWIGGLLGMLLVWIWLRLPGNRAPRGERLRV